MNKNSDLKFNSEGISKFYDLSDVEFSMQLLEKHLSCLKFEEEEEEFNYVCSVLPFSACKLVKNIILDPPSKNATKMLKMALIERSFSLEVQKSNKSLAIEEINYHKPSLILQRMREAFKDMDDDDLLPLYRKLVPNSLQSTIDNLPNNVELNVVATFADVVYMESIKIRSNAKNTCDTNITAKSVMLEVNDEQTRLSQKVDLLESSLLSTLEIIKAYFRAKKNQSENLDVETESADFLMPDLLKILGKRCGLDI